MRAALLAALVLAAAPAAAEDCAALRAAAKRALYDRVGAEAARAAGREVAAALTPGERAELAHLADRFNATPHGTPAQQDARVAWQLRARQLTRTAAARARRGPRNPERSPYDAVFSAADGRDGLPWLVAEARSLLVLGGVPHATIWVHRLDPAHNPERVINLGLMDDPSRDYASWAGPDGRRVAGTVDDLVSTLLPPGCR